MVTARARPRRRSARRRDHLTRREGDGCADELGPDLGRVVIPEHNGGRLKVKVAIAPQEPALSGCGARSRDDRARRLKRSDEVVAPCQRRFAAHPRFNRPRFGYTPKDRGQLEAQRSRKLACDCGIVKLCDGVEVDIQLVPLVREFVRRRNVASGARKITRRLATQRRQKLLDCDDQRF